MPVWAVGLRLRLTPPARESLRASEGGRRLLPGRGVIRPDDRHHL